MDSFNRVISFVLGLVVVLVFVAVVTGKLNFKKGLPTLSKATVTPKVSVTPTPTSGSASNTGSTANSNNYGSYTTTGKTTTPKTIPSTGLPTLFIPSLMAMAGSGVFLRKAGKK